MSIAGLNRKDHSYIVLVEDYRYTILDSDHISDFVSQAINILSLSKFTLKPTPKTSQRTNQLIFQQMV